MIKQMKKWLWLKLINYTKYAQWVKCTYCHESNTWHEDVPCYDCSRAFENYAKIRKDTQAMYKRTLELEKQRKAGR